MSKFSFLVLLFVGILLFPKLAQAATLTFTPSLVTLATGEEQPISLMLEPEKAAVIGVDVMLRFDPQFVHVTAIEKTDAFSDIAGKTIDNTNGTARFSVINDHGVYQKHAGSIATVTITAVEPTPQTALVLEFIGGKTRDSNVVTANGHDALTRVNAVSIRITKTEKTSSPIPSATVESAAGVVTNSNANSKPTALPLKQANPATIAAVLKRPAVSTEPKIVPSPNPVAAVKIQAAHLGIDGDKITWYFLGAVAALFAIIKLVSFLIAYGKSKLVVVLKI